MAVLSNIEVELEGTLTRGISEIALEDGELKVTLTDGTEKSLGSVLPETSSEFSPLSDGIPTMSAVASYVSEMLTLDTEEMI